MSGKRFSAELSFWQGRDSPDAQRLIEGSLSASLFDGHPGIRCYRKDGESFWAIVFIGPVLNADGHVMQHFVSFIRRHSPPAGGRHLRARS